MQSQAEPIQEISVYRDPRYSSYPRWKPEVVESCLGVFKMKIDALSFDSQRASFSWKAPGLGLLCQNQIFLEASVATPRRPTRPVRPIR